MEAAACVNTDMRFMCVPTSSGDLDPGLDLRFTVYSVKREREKCELNLHPRLRKMADTIKIWH